MLIDIVKFGTIFLLRVHYIWYTLILERQEI